MEIQTMGKVEHHSAIYFQYPKGVDREEAFEIMYEEMIKGCKEKGIDTEAKNFHFVDIGLPCGYRASYKTKNDVPRHDVPCPCGDEAHWLVKWHEF